MSRSLPAVACVLALVFAFGLWSPVARAQDGVILETEAARVGEAGEEGEEEAGEEAGAAEGEEDERGLTDRVQDKLREFCVQLDEVFVAVTARKVLAILLIPVSLVLGGVLLLFGWRLLSGFFVPFSSLMGAFLGAALGFQLVLALSEGPAGGGAVVAAVIGGLAAAGLFCVSSLKAPPIAWFLIVAAPFLVISTLLFPAGGMGELFAVLVVLVGLVLGFASMMKRQPMVIFSTALLGTLSLVFCFGIIAHLTEAESLQSVLDFLYKYPFALAGGIVVLMLVGGDLQFVTSPTETGDIEVPPGESS